MKYIFLRSKWIFSFTALLLVFSCSKKTTAQVIPDNTLGIESTTIRSIDQLRDAIEGGAIRGDNLFHSFEQFNINEGTRVDFANPEGISNIFSRVTGGNISEIFGTLSVDGSANLFLMNPNGIIFGENAAINVGGSFIATTAENIEFNNGNRFSAVNREKPLLTIDFPIGLGLNSNSGSIKVEGTGHSLRLADTSDISTAFNSPIVGSQENRSLVNVAEGTVGLIGNKIELDGATIANSSGNIEIGSIESGIVGVNLANEKIDFDYEQIDRFADISLGNRSLLDTSGISVEKINVYGKNISLFENSLIFSSNVGSSPAEEININATESFTLTGITSPESFFDFSVIKPGVISQSLQQGNGSDINISAGDIVLKDFSLVTSGAFGSGSSGNIEAKVRDSIRIVGTPPLEGIPALSGVSSTTISSGEGGDINLIGNNLFLEEGGLIISQSLQQGSSGNIDASFTDSIEIKGSFALDTNSNSFLGSVISSTTTFAQGGNITVNTENLLISDGSRISTTTNGVGDAGDTLINANYVSVAGTAIGSNTNSEENASQIIASVEIPDPFLVELFNLPPVSEGESGSLTINTQELSISDNGRIGVANQGTGDGGNLQINADSISLNDAGSISASTVSGEGGNITINSNNLELFNQSTIAANAGELGNGGNITIDSDTILGLNNSDVTANAFRGNGGNITINSDFIVGLEEQPELTFNSDITASSEFGIDGTVTVNAPDNNLGEEAIAVFNSYAGESRQQLTKRTCFPRRNSKGGKLVYLGRGGVPASPYNFFGDEDIVGVEGIPTESRDENGDPELWVKGDPIIDSNAIRVGADGDRYLVTEMDAEDDVCPGEAEN